MHGHALGFRAIVGLLGGLLAVSGCGGKGEKSGTASDATGKPAGEVVATYKGHTVTADEVRKQLEQMAPPARTYLSSLDRKRSFVENMIMNDLMYAEGSKLGYDTDPEVQRQVQNLQKRLVVQKIMAKYQALPTISDEDVRKYYDDNTALYSTAQIHASHILVKDESTAKEILAEVKAHPEKFADIAREKSIDTVTAQKGGDLGTFAQGRMVPDFERAAFALQPGQISDVVATQYGYHIIMVTERQEGERRPFDQVKEQIRATLRNKLLQDRVRAHFDELKKDAEVKIDDDALGRLNPAEGLPATVGHPMPMGH